MKERFVTLGDVFMCDLGQGIGSEQSGIRPIVIVSNAKCCIYSDVIYGIPITKQEKTPLPLHHNLYKSKYDFLRYDDNTALCEQYRPVSKQRLKEKMGHLELDDIYELVEKSKKNLPW